MSTGPLPAIPARALRWVALASLLLTAPGIRGSQPADLVLPEPRVERFTDRRILDLDWESTGGKAPIAGRMRIYLHGERAYSAYFVPRGSQEPIGVVMTLQRAGETIAGPLGSLKHEHHGRISGHLTLTLGAAPTATLQINGSQCQARIENVDIGRMARDNAIAVGSDYPQIGGADCMGPAPTSARIVENIGLAKLLWRSEDTPLLTAPDYRIPGFGLSSPVVARGLVIFNYRQPTGEPPYFSKGNRKLVIEKAMLDESFRPYLSRQAHDIVVAVDAATGLTRWRTVLPLRAMNYQGDQKANSNGGPVPCVVGERLVVPGHGGRLYGLDLMTGALVWERIIAESSFDVIAAWKRQYDAPMAGTPNIGGLEGTLLACEPVACAGVVALDVQGVVAVDPATGATLWHDPNRKHVATRDHVRTLRAGGRDLFAYPRSKDRDVEFALVEPRSGTVALAAGIGVTVKDMGWCVMGGRLIVFSNRILGGGGPHPPMQVHGFDPDLAGGRWLKAWSLTLDRPCVQAGAAMLADGHVFLGGVRTHEIAQIDPANGKLIGWLPALGGQNSYFEASAGWQRVIQKEASSLRCVVAGPTRTQKPSELLMPVTHGYEDMMPRMAWADGRLFMAVDCGIACIDLRQKP